MIIAFRFCFAFASCDSCWWANNFGLVPNPWISFLLKNLKFYTLPLMNIVNEGQGLNKMIYNLINTSNNTRCWLFWKSQPTTQLGQSCWLQNFHFYHIIYRLAFCQLWQLFQTVNSSREYICNRHWSLIFLDLFGRCSNCLQILCTID